MNILKQYDTTYYFYLYICIKSKHNTMNLKELVHKRILVAEKQQGYNAKQTVEEYKILEVSPSGNFVKLQNMNGNKFWKTSADIIPIEILIETETKPRLTI